MPLRITFFFILASSLLLNITTVLSLLVVPPAFSVRLRTTHQRHLQRWNLQPAPTTTNLPISRVAVAASRQEQQQSTDSVEKTTEKFGLEAGLFQSLKRDDGGESAKSLLKRYGVAYLATSIPLAIISFAICYVLVDNGVDVSSLLSKVGIETDGSMAEKAGTAAIAYAAHKAASPIRFPPTVILTPIVAKAIGKEPNVSDDDE